MPEQIQTDQQQESNNSNQESNNNSASQSQQTTNQNQDGPTNELLLEALREANRLRQEAEGRALATQQELEAFRRPAAPAPNQVNIDYNQFVENPGAAIAQVVQQQIAPLNAFTTRMRREQSYNQIKAHLRAQQPMFSQIEAYVDAQVIPQLDNVDPSLPLVQQAVTMVVGQIALSNPGIFNQQQQAPTQQQPPAPAQNVPSQAHLRPSSSPQPAQQNNDKKPTRQLTELERRLAREWKMSDEQYIEHLEKPARVK